VSDTVTITLLGGMYSGETREMPNDQTLNYCNVVDSNGGTHWYKRIGDDWLFIDSTVGYPAFFTSVVPIDAAD